MTHAMMTLHAARETTPGSDMSKAMTGLAAEKLTELVAGARTGAGPERPDRV